MMPRRTLLRSLAAGAALAATPGWAEAGAPAWLACAREADGGFALFGLRPDGSLAFRVPLPARGHAGARHPLRAEAAILARRPGSYALIVDCATGRIAARLAVPEGLHFNGHAAYLARGAVLATAEQRAEDSTGLIGLWDSTTWTRLGEWPSGGIGPHEIVALPDGRLAVANGGIATDPGDRRKLNIDRMRPNLTVLAADGTIDDQADLPTLHQASIRHLSVRSDGRLAVAMQWEGPSDRIVPLLGHWQPGAALRLAEAAADDWRRMHGYAGSVAWSGDGTRVAVTSPRGGRVLVFDAEFRLVGGHDRPDVCGLAAAPSGCVASDGGGGLLAIDAQGSRRLAVHPVAFDNHIVAV